MRKPRDAECIPTLMHDRNASVTAMGVATLRAAHQMVDDDPKILDDPIASQLLDRTVIESILANVVQFQKPRVSRLRLQMILRSRYAEDRLAEAAARGVRQCVVLGAGFETFAYRQPEWARALHIFEVDHPASQNAKLERLDRAGIALPDNVAFVPIDFEAASLDDVLRHSSFDASQPAFFSCLGLLVYLNSSTIDDLFLAVASLARTTEIVFTYARPAPLAVGSNAPDARRRRSTAAVAASLGEPWLTHFDPEALERKLRGMGYREVTFLTPADATQRYLRNRSDAMLPPKRLNIGSAIV